MSYGTVQAEKVTTESGYSLGAGNASSFKNRIINGNMAIDQRNSGASVTVTTSTGYTLDRWQAYASQSSKYSVQQNAGSVTPPSGFAYYLGATSLSAYSVTSTDIFTIRQIIEGYNIADLNWGTANAKPIVISFWVYSSLTGTFGGAICNNGQTRSYPFTYTISSANTWEFKTVSIAGDTSGTWNTSSGRGIDLFLSLGVGSTYTGTAGAWAGTAYYNATGATSVVATNGATFYITGVQLEVGTVATSFDFRPYGTELALCQRYFQSWGGETQYTCFAQGTSMSSGTQIICNMIPIVQMRVGPSFSSTGQFGVVYTGNVVNATTSTLVSNQTTSNGFSFLMNSLSGSLPSTGYAVSIATTELTSRFRLSSEL